MMGGIKREQRRPGRRIKKPSPSCFCHNDRDDSYVSFYSIIALVAIVSIVQVHGFVLQHGHRSSSTTSSSSLILQYCNSNNLSIAEEGNDQDDAVVVTSPSSNGGLFRPFATCVEESLLNTGYMKRTIVNPGLQYNVVDYGEGNDQKVYLSVITLQGVTNTSPLSYCRIVLMETIPTQNQLHAEQPPKEIESSKKSDHRYHHDGLHALNILIFPNTHDRSTTTTTTTITTKESSSSNIKDYPIWGVSMAHNYGIHNVSMATIDAQPISFSKEINEYYATQYKEWYGRHVSPPKVTTEHTKKSYNNLPWGGTLRNSTQSFISPYVLWTKFNTTSSTTPIETILQEDVYEACKEHLNIYLQNIVRHNTDENNDIDISSRTEQENNHHHHHNNNKSIHRTTDRRTEFCNYWRYNEPERSTLTKLFGKEWTERLLWEIMFPPSPPTANNNNNNE
jgi:hypothetical protein